MGDMQAVASEFRSSTWSSQQMVQDTIDAAIYHRVVPQLVEALIGLSEDGPLLDEAMRVYRAQTAHVLRLENLLRLAVTTLTDVGIAAALFKGPALAHCYYDSPTQRTCADIDLLVSPENMCQANQELTSAGLESTGVGWRSALNAGYGEVSYQSVDETLLDLHWHPIREPAIRRVFGWATSDLLNRATISQVGDLRVPVLDPEDMLIAVATHACYSGAYRLGWLLDVAQIERRGLVRWNVLRERCEDSGLGLPVQVILDRARRTLRYDSDGSWPLARGPWRTSTATLATLRPIEDTFGQVGRGGIVYRSTRRTALASMTALAANLLDEVAKPMLTDPEHRWKQRRDQRDR